MLLKVILKPIKVVIRRILQSESALYLRRNRSRGFIGSSIGGTSLCTHVLYYDCTFVLWPARELISVRRLHSVDVAQPIRDQPARALTNQEFVVGEQSCKKSQAQQACLRNQNEKIEEP